MATKSELCIRCGDCCKFFILEIRRPDLLAERKNWAEWMAARGVSLIKEHSKWWRLKIPFACPHLRVVEREALIITQEHPKDASYYCDIYPTRPKVCKDFDGRLESDRDGLKCLWLTEKPED